MRILQSALCALLVLSSPLLIDRNLVDLVLVHAIAWVPLLAAIELR